MYFTQAVSERMYQPSERNGKSKGDNIKACLWLDLVLENL